MPQRFPVVELLACTQPNPALHGTARADASDVASLWQGQSTFAANLIEYAARLCYRSTHRMGTSPNFISARVREGHEDVIEHVVVTLRWTDTDEPALWREASRHCEISRIAPRTWLVSGNTRVWLHFFREGRALEAVPLLKALVPEVYDEFDCEPETLNHLPAVAQEPTDTLLTALQPVHKPPQRVVLLGYTQPVLDDPAVLLDHGSACFLFEGISRACTHQLVRHRLASFSQESQRYVDLTKGGWNAVVPPRVARNQEARELLDQSWESLQETYLALRGLGIRKEDARFLLPNATETRIVTTMNFAAWSHFLWLRAVDKAAQWEIRAMGQEILCMLHAVAPKVFQDHMNVFESMQN